MECSHRNGSRSFNLVLAVCLLTPGVALAADNGFYLGGSASDVSSDYGAPVGAGPARDDDGFKLIGGVRPLDSFAIEANYVDLGTTRVPLTIACITTPCPSQVSIDSRAVSVSAVGHVHAAARRLVWPRRRDALGVRAADLVLAEGRGHGPHVWGRRPAADRQFRRARRVRAIRVRRLTTRT